MQYLEHRPQEARFDRVRKRFFLRTSNRAFLSRSYLDCERVQNEYLPGHVKGQDQCRVPSSLEEPKSKTTYPSKWTKSKQLCYEVPKSLSHPIVQAPRLDPKLFHTYTLTIIRSSHMWRIPTMWDSRSSFCNAQTFWRYGTISKLTKDGKNIRFHNSTWTSPLHRTTCSQSILGDSDDFNSNSPSTTLAYLAL